jgi:hypothetical protein
MVKIYVSFGTEYESGYGQRPDGILLTLDKDVMLKEINTQTNLGSYECYCRYSIPEIYYCNTETYSKIENNMINDGYYYLSKNSLSDLGQFFKEV